MLPWGCCKVKLEEDDDGRSFYDTAGSAGATVEYRAWVKAMSANMTAEAGFHHSTLREFANDIDGLVHRAYALMPPDIQSKLACDHFLQALPPTCEPRLC